MTGRTSWRTRHMYRTPEPPMPDRNELTPITPLSSRLELEQVIRDTKANTRETHENTQDIGTLVAAVTRIEKVGIATAAAIADHLKEEQARPRVRAAELRAYAAVLAVFVGGVTQWRVSQAGAESREQAQIAAAQAYERKADADREKVVQRVAEDTARRAAEEVRRAIHEEQSDAERRASMRVPKR